MSHIYDFRTTTKTNISIVGKTTRDPQKNIVKSGKKARPMKEEWVLNIEKLYLYLECSLIEIHGGL